jgi:hypothetical protein
VGCISKDKYENLVLINNTTRYVHYSNDEILLLQEYLQDFINLVDYRIEKGYYIIQIDSYHYNIDLKTYSLANNNVRIPQAGVYKRYLKDESNVSFRPKGTLTATVTDACIAVNTNNSNQTVSFMPNQIFAYMTPAEIEDKLKTTSSYYAISRYDESYLYIRKHTLTTTTEYKISLLSIIVDDTWNN